MDRKRMVDLAFVGIALALLPTLYHKIFEHKSHADYRKPTALN